MPFYILATQMAVMILANVSQYNTNSCDDPGKCLKMVPFLYILLQSKLFDTGINTLLCISAFYQKLLF